MSFRVKKGDNVLLITGKDKGKSGRVLKVFPKKERLIVEGLNRLRRHTRPRGDQPGGIIEKEAPLHISNVMIVCPSCNRKTRIGASFLKDGTKVRICKRCNQPLDR